MKSTRQKARSALLVALGFAVTTFLAPNNSTAEDSPLLQALQMSQAQELLDVQPVAYTTPSAWVSPVAEDNGEEADNGDEDEESLEEKFEKFQESLDELEESIDEVADVAGDKQIVKSGTSRNTMVVSGRVHFDAWGFDDKDPTIALFESNDDDDFDINDPSTIFDPRNRIGFRRLRFGVKGKIQDNMEYKIEMEFAGGNDVEFRDAYLGWNDLPFLRTLLLGNQKRPYGLDHLNSSRYNVFLERPFIIEGNNQDARRLGLGSYGVSENQRWNWRFGVWNQRNVQGLGNYLDDHLQLEVAGRLANTIWYDNISDGRGYAHWAIAYSHGDASDTDNGSEARYRTRPEARSANRWLQTERISDADYQDLLGLEGVINIGRFSVVGEYQKVWVNRVGAAPDLDFDGGYVYVAYWLTDDFTPWERKSGTLGRTKPIQNFWLVNLCNGCCEGGWGAWQVAGRWSKADYTDQDIFGGVGESFTFGLNWWWNPNARVQFNYITGEISERGIGNNLPLFEGDYDIYGTRFMVDF